MAIFFTIFWSFLLAISDEEEEGKWIDWYTLEEIDLLDKVAGTLGKNLNWCCNVFCVCISFGLVE